MKFPNEPYLRADLPVRSIDLSDVAAGDATKTDELSAGREGALIVYRYSRYLCKCH